MEIEIVELKELNYNELVKANKPISGDIILMKEKNSDVWDVQFVTIVTNMGIYLHSDADGLDGGGVIFWPDYNIHKLYDDSKFIHILIKTGK
jgi:uncharacterized protein (UPF0179 family)